MSDAFFSELDTQRREHFLRHVLQHEQALLTATDLSSFPQEVLSQAKLYKVEHGTLSGGVEPVWATKSARGRI